jgi:hypothetical protein
MKRSIVFFAIKCAANFTAIALLTFATVCSAKEVTKETASGGINWSKGIVYATGYGTAKPELSSAQRRILSRRAAIVDAQRNLLEITKGVRINSTVTTDKAMKEHRDIATRVEGIIKGARVTKDHYQNEVATVTMTMPIAGDFLRTLYPAEQYASNQYPAATYAAEERSIFSSNEARQIIIKNTPTWELLPQLMSAGAQAVHFFIPGALASNSLMISNEPEAKAYRKLILWMQENSSSDLQGNLQEAIIHYESNARFSGLLIDASAVPNFELATIPRIRDEAGNILYPSKQTSYDDIVNKRGVTYDFDLEDAIRNQRIATTPFIIKAISTYKSLPSDLVIMSADAKSILQSQSTVMAMNKAGVLIVVAL